MATTLTPEQGQLIAEQWERIRVQVPVPDTSAEAPSADEPPPWSVANPPTVDLPRLPTAQDLPELPRTAPDPLPALPPLEDRSAPPTQSQGQFWSIPPLPAPNDLPQLPVADLPDVATVGPPEIPSVANAVQTPEPPATPHDSNAEVVALLERMAAGMQREPTLAPVLGPLPAPSVLPWW